MLAGANRWTYEAGEGSLMQLKAHMCHTNKQNNKNKQILSESEAKQGPTTTAIYDLLISLSIFVLISGVHSRLP